MPPHFFITMRQDSGKHLRFEAVEELCDDSVIPPLNLILCKAIAFYGFKVVFVAPFMLDYLIIVVDIAGREIPIVHRVIKVHGAKIRGGRCLSKGDNNFGDDRLLYAHGQLWLQQHHIMGRAVGFLPYVGWVTIIMTEKPIIKYLLIGALGLLVITSKE
ncbi:hypothetical protein HPP92_019882 [Vanilla planifolia]|uniref:Signal peptidase complex catalytic subunit SEC11 n=1 Tax=Vanilla planifolia TaxID=51239 RepID=A0A835Q6L2_VANPL|nr:hypothetical protein HPP92_019882 [Vanilla planifolia]